MGVGHDVIKILKDLSQFQWKSAHAPKKELPKDFFVTKSDENHIMSLFNPILDIPKRSKLQFSMEWEKFQ